MKTKKLLKLLVLNVLCLMTTHTCFAQEWMILAHTAEKYTELPAMSCFSPTRMGLLFRNDFGTKEMMFANISGVVAIQKNRLFLDMTHYGYTNYGELTLAAGYGRSFGNRFAMTARVFYLMAHTRNYPARHSLSTDFSLACRTSPKLMFDVAVYNPFMLRYGIVGEAVIPMKFIIGCTFIPVSKLLLSIITSKALPGGWEVDGRFMVQPASPLILAVDCSNVRLGLYVGWRYRQFLLSVRASWHYRISVSPEIGGFYFQKTEER